MILRDAGCIRALETELAMWTHLRPDLSARVSIWILPRPRDITPEFNDAKRHIPALIREESTRLAQAS